VTLVPDLSLPETRLLPAAAYRRGGKRALDLLLVLAVALPVLAVLLPLMAAIALDGHSPFYVQERLGRGGRVFRMWKLRSMRPDADAALRRLLALDPEARAEWDHAQKLRRDPRVTPVGRLIRRSSLDELPQLWNVLKGDMSLVGPRPMMPGQRALYPGTEYFDLRPGLTGPWQVSARNETGFAERAAFDRLYLRSLSFATDLAIVLRTVRVVLRGTGC
jgi:exopolysaccharide production protein ExoY